MANETYEEKVSEAKAYLVDYLKDGKEIKRNQQELSDPNLKPEQREQINNNIIHRQECQRSTVFIVKYEHQVNIQQELDLGNTPRQVMNAIRKSIEQKHPKTDPAIVTDPDTSGDRGLDMQMEQPTKPHGVNRYKLAKDQKQEAEQTRSEPEKPHQTPAPDHTINVEQDIPKHLRRYMENAKSREERETHHEREHRPSRNHGYTIER